MISFKVLLLSTCFTFGVSYAIAQNNSLDSYTILIEKADTSNFIQSNFNYLQFSDRNLVEKLNYLFIHSKERKIKIAHFGDSHVQLDHFPSTVRRLMQASFGNAGRGILFPFSMCKTYSHIDFESKYTGTWITANSIQTPPKLPVGILGFVAQTSGPKSSFSIKFKNSYIETNEKLSLLFSENAFNYDISVQGGKDYTTAGVLIDTEKSGNIFRFPVTTDSFIVNLMRKNDDSSRISLFGLMLNNDKPGVIYHNLGVGGSIYSAMLHQTYFSDQFNLIDPDIAVLDWGTNDIIYKDRIADTLESTIINTVRKLRSQKPEILIILTSVQDMNWKGKNVTACKNFNELIKKLARNENCLYFDWYQISGGPNTMKRWEEKGLARKDNIHLTREGYILKGELFFNAIINTIGLINENKTIQQLYINSY
jgi:hypothetical protein